MQRAMRRVTLMDVAKDAGVSRATASLVLRDSPLVADETRQRVLSSMRKLGYVYNRAAASLRTQRSYTIGLIVTDITNPFFAQMTVGSEAHLDQASYGVLLSNTAERLGKQDRLLRMMHEYGVDGVLLCPAMGTSPETVERLHRWRLPLVLVARYLPEIDVDYVGADNVSGAQMAVEHLVALGHRRIAFVGGPRQSSARRDRLRGYQSALVRHGLSVDDTLSVPSPVTRDGGHRAISELLEHPDPPTAALCYNDVVAFGVMLRLQAAHKAPGTDLAVIGFDDIDEAALWRPALTTVSISPRQVGIEAAQLLLDRIDHPEGAPRQVILRPRLVVRESCGAKSEGG
jgi:LacI family transcriptional regulator